MDEGGVLVEVGLKGFEVVIDVCYVLRLKYLYVEDTFDINIAFELSKGGKGLANLSIWMVYVFLDVKVLMLDLLLIEVTCDHYVLVYLTVHFTLLTHRIV